MRALAILLHLATLLAGPILLVGVVNRTKSIWVGRKGVPLLQLGYDLARLVRKRPVYSTVATVIVRWAPFVALGTALVSGLFVPLVGQGAPISFPFDFVFVAYCWGLGRLFLMLGALDTGSAFEGMGASREATYSALVEPALFLAAGSLAASVGSSAFADLLRIRLDTPASVIVWGGAIAALFVLLQVESARVPVDDPATHLELTMIHEVMVLDHSGSDLAAIQYAAAVKLLVGAGILAALLNPIDPARSAGVYGVVNVGLILAVGVVVGTIESLMARLKLKVLPQYTFGALVAALLSVLASAWRVGIPG